MELDYFSSNVNLDLVIDDFIKITPPCIVNSAFEDVKDIPASFYYQLPDNNQELKISRSDMSFDENRFEKINTEASSFLQESLFEQKEIEKDLHYGGCISQESRTSANSDSTTSLNCFDFITFPSACSLQLSEDNFEVESSNRGKESVSETVFKLVTNARKICKENPINKVIEHIHTNAIDPYLEMEELFKIATFLQKLPVKPQFTFLSKKTQADPLTEVNCCSCKKSHCVKMYCECFKFGKLCYNCTCLNCLNRQNFQGLRQHSIQFIKNKSNHAFKNVLERNLTSEKHVKGCKCKSSGCKKNYCECYQYGVKCSEKCKCQGCLNGTCRIE